MCNVGTNLPTMLVMVLNLSRSQSTVRMRAICSVPRSTALSTITRVTKPALGMPAAPIAATVAVSAVITISGTVHLQVEVSFAFANINLSPINMYVCRKSSILMPSLFVTLRGDNPGSWNIFNEYIHLSLELYLNLV